VESSAEQSRKKAMVTAAAVYRNRTRGTALLAGSAMASLLLGVGVYLIGRDWGSVLFLQPFAALQPSWNIAAMPAGAWLPSLLHAYGFALLIILMLRPHPRAPVYGASGWLLIAALLEWLQSTPAEALILSTADLPQPLRRFAGRDAVFEPEEDAPKLVFPPTGARLPVEGGRLPVKLRDGTPPFTWMANGAPVASGLHRREALLPGFTRGYSTLSVIDADGRADRVTVWID